MNHRDVGLFSSRIEETKKPFNVDEYLEKTDSKYMFEKNQSPTKWRRKLRMLNLGGFIYFLIFTVTAMLVGYWITLPEVYRNDPELFWNRKVLAAYIFVMTFANYALIVLKFKHSKFGVHSAYLPVDSQVQWRKCPNCDIMVPPRAKHCILCDSCILKRDHHCFFAGCCIGFHNQRYFCVFCFYGCLGAMYSLYATYFYLDKYYTPLFSLDFYGYLIPWLVWRWFLGNIHHSIIWFTLLLYMSFATMATCAFFFSWQTFLLFNGQTTYEFLKKDKMYKRPLHENLHTVFGNWSLVNFVLPLPWIHNLGNGIVWRTTCGLQEKHL